MLRRRWVIGTSAGLCVVAAVAPVAIALPNLYSVGAKLLVEGRPMNAVFASPTAGLEGRLQTIKTEALSRARLTALIEQLDLYPDLRRKGLLNGAIDRLQKDIKVDVTSASQAGGGQAAVSFSVGFCYRDPVKTAAVTNWLAQFYVAQNDDIRSRQAKRTTDLFKGQVDDAKKKLNDMDQRLQNYMALNAGSLPQAMEANVRTLAGVNNRINANTAEQIRLANAKTAFETQIATIKNRPAPAVVDPQMSPQAALDLANKNLADALSKYGPDHPNVRSARRDVIDAENRVSQSRPAGAPADHATGASELTLAQENLKATTTQLDKATQEGGDLERQRMALEAKLQSAPISNTEFDSIVKDRTLARDLYDGLQKRYNDARLAEQAERGGDSDEFRVLDPAMEPALPAGPNRLMLLGIALMGALAAFVAAAVAVERLDTSFHNLEELRSFTRLPVLASIPTITTRRDRWQRGLKSGAVLGIVIAILAVLGAAVFHRTQHSEGLTRMFSKL
jgi:polysaccharide chain length determinant protein (PEP-CTERM system associated)